MIRYKIFLCLSVVLLAGAAQSVRAQNYPYLDRVVTGNAITLNPTSINAGNVSNWQLTNDLVNGYKATTTASIPVGAATIPVNVASTIPKLAVAKAIGNFALKVAAPLQLGLAVYDLAQELGFTLKKSPAGTLVVERLYPDGSGQYICFAGCSGVFNSGELLAACNAHFNPTNNPNSYCKDEPHPDVYYIMTSGGGVSAGGRFVLNDTTKLQPSTLKEFEDAVAAKSGWPSSSAILEATRQAIKSGESVQATPQVLTGPASSPGEKTTTTTAAKPATATSPATAPTTTTNTTTNNYNYEGNKVTVTTTTVTNTTNNNTGETTTDTKTTDPLVPSPDPVTTTDPTPEEPAIDTALGEQPKLYTRVYPDGIKGVWTAQKDAMSATSLIRLIPSLMPTVGNGGSCPHFPINLSFATWATFGTSDFAPPCWVWDFGKAVIMLSALLLARALVFGG